MQRLRKDINDLLSHDFSCTSSTASVSPGESCEGFFLSLCIHDGPYRGGHFTFYLGVPDTYPFSMVQVTAVNRPIWHPNIDMDTGVVLIPLEWTPVMTLTIVALSIQLLMLEPSADNPLNTEACSYFINSSGPGGAFDQRVQRIFRGCVLGNVEFPCMDQFECPQCSQLHRQSS